MHVYTRPDKRTRGRFQCPSYVGAIPNWDSPLRISTWKGFKSLAGSINGTLLCEERERVVLDLHYPETMALLPLSFLF